MYYAELNVPKNHVYLFKPQPKEGHARTMNVVYYAPWREETSARQGRKNFNE